MAWVLIELIRPLRLAWDGEGECGCDERARCLQVWVSVVSAGVAIVEMAGPIGKGDLPVGYQPCVLWLYWSAGLDFEQFPPIRSYSRPRDLRVLQYIMSDTKYMDMCLLPQPTSRPRPRALSSSNYLPFCEFNGYRVIGELSCGNELPNGVHERSRWVFAFAQVKTLQGR
jgi:hypothetical protein